MLESRARGSWLTEVPPRTFDSPAGWLLWFQEGRLRYSFFGVLPDQPLSGFSPDPSGIGILQPCEPTVYVVARAHAADSHWLVRAVVDTKSPVVAIPGLGRVPGAVVQPLWLLDRADSLVEDVLTQARAQLKPCNSASNSGADFFLLPCQERVRGCALMKDWRIQNDIDHAYGPSKMLFLDNWQPRSMPTYTFCTHTNRFSRSCRHHTLGNICLG